MTLYGWWLLLNGVNNNFIARGDSNYHHGYHYISWNTIKTYHNNENYIIYELDYFLHIPKVKNYIRNRFGIFHFIITSILFIPLSLYLGIYPIPGWTVYCFWLYIVYCILYTFWLCCILYIVYCILFLSVVYCILYTFCSVFIYVYIYKMSFQGEKVKHRIKH